jgi:hypothetical protein
MQLMWASPGNKIPPACTKADEAKLFLTRKLKPDKTELKI